MVPASKLPDLRGAWRIRRRISPEGARFIGTAEIAGEDGTLLYRETGVLLTGGVRHEAFRHYIYLPEETGLEIRHPDGSPFLKLVFMEGQATATHICGQDRYEALFRFKGPNRFLTAFDISGPRKKHRIVSLLTRV